MTNNDEKLKYFIWGMAQVLEVETDEIDIKLANKSMKWFEENEDDRSIEHILGGVLS